MLRLEYGSGSDSDGEFQPLLRMLERHPSHSSIEFIEKSDSLPRHSDRLEHLTPSPTPSSPQHTNTVVSLPAYHPCPCCQVNQSNFYCPDCIISGFYLSHTSNPSPNRSDLSQRQEYLTQSMKRGQDLRDRIRPLLEQHRDRMLAYQELTCLQTRLRAQRRAVESESERVRVDRNRLKQLIARNTKRKEQLAEASRGSFSEYIQECEERCTTSRNRLARMSEQLMNTRRLCLQEIQSDCFLIQKTTSLSPIPGCSQSANQRNKHDFVMVDPGSEKYSILDCYLPPAFLYVPKLCSHTDTDTTSSLDMSRSLCSESERTATLAALSHSAHLIQTIAFILDILLPDHLSFYSFNIPDTGVDTAQLCSASALLENNVVYLAATQGVPHDLLLKGHALENLLTLLNRRNPRLGQRHAFSPYPELSVRENQLLGIESANPEGVTRLSSITSDSDSEWEDLEKSFDMSESGDATVGLSQLERSQQENSRPRFLSFFWRSAEPDK